MWNKTVKDIVYKYERLYDWYDTGPVRRAILEDFVEEIVNKCAKVAADAYSHQLPASEYSNLIKEEFGFNNE